MEDFLEVRQFKLASGDEILCEILQWQDQEGIEICIRKAMKLVMNEGDDGVKYYSFRPWMIYQENSEDIIILSASMVIGIGFPVESLLYQYYEAVEDMHQMSVVRDAEHMKKVGADNKGSKIQQTIKEINKTAKNLQDYLSGDSSGPGNVIPLFDPKKVH